MFAMTFHTDNVVFDDAAEPDGAVIVEVTFGDDGWVTTRYLMERN